MHYASTVLLLTARGHLDCSAWDDTVVRFTTDRLLSAGGRLETRARSPFSSLGKLHASRRCESRCSRTSSQLKNSQTRKAHPCVELGVRALQSGTLIAAIGAGEPEAVRALLATGADVAQASALSQNGHLERARSSRPALTSLRMASRRCSCPLRAVPSSCARCPQGLQMWRCSRPALCQWLRAPRRRCNRDAAASR